MTHRYFAALRSVLERAEATQAANIDSAARLLAEATARHRRLYAFGSNHAGALAMELYYRTGGLANFQIISLPGLRLDLHPPSLTSRMEGLPGYGRLLAEGYPMEPGDVLVIHSVSGKNPVTLDVALSARERGAKLVALTNVELSRGLAPCHPCGKRLFEMADVVIDNCGGPSDAMLTVEGCPQRVGPSSTAAGAAILGAVVAQAVQYLTDMGLSAPVLASCNAQGGNQYNAKLLKE